MLANIKSTWSKLVQGGQLYWAFPLPLGFIAKTIPTPIIWFQDTQELTHLCREGQGETMRAMQLAKNIATNLGKLQVTFEQEKTGPPWVSKVL